MSLRLPPFACPDHAVRSPFAVVSVPTDDPLSLWERAGVRGHCKTYHDCHSSSSRIQVHQGGSRSGKTFSILQFLIETAIFANNTGNLEERRHCGLDPQPPLIK